MHNCLIPVLHFLDSRGMDALFDLTRKLNSGMSHKAIARSLGFCPSQFSEFVSNTFERQYTLKQDVQQLIVQLEENHERRFREQRRSDARSCTVLALAGTRGPTHPEADRP